MINIIALYSPVGIYYLWLSRMAYLHDCHNRLNFKLSNLIIMSYLNQCISIYIIAKSNAM